MKQTLLLTLFSFAISVFMTACTSQMADKMAVVGNPTLSSDPCAALDQKLIKLDEFTTMVNNTSAFHLEEKAAALQVSGITVSNNKEQMLRDAKKKHAELLAERQKYGCKTPMPSATGQMVDKMSPCAALDQKLIKLDEFAIMVNNTSAFHLEEKAAALQVPGITVSNNKEQMLRDIKKKRAELSVERQRYGCKTPMPISTSQMVDKKDVVSKPTLPSDQRDAIDQKLIKSDESETTVNNTSDSHLEEKTAALPVPGITVSNNKEKILKDAKKKHVAPSAERQKYGEETPRRVGTPQMSDKTEAVRKPTLSSDSCASIVEELIKLDEFTIMVNNTSAFHLEEKASALPVPGITVSNNKKQMLRDAKKKRAALLTEHKKYGCKTSYK